MRRSVDRFCRNCGYEFQPDDTGQCRMCARFEQSRIGFAVPRPSELASRQTPLQEPLDGDDPPSVDWPPTPAEYRAILAERRARTPSADGQSRGPVLGALALPPPAKSAKEAPTAELAGEAPAPPKKKSTARRRPPTPSAPTAGASPAPPKKRATARRKNSKPTAELAGEAPAPPKKRAATGRNNSTPTPTPTPVWPTPILIRLRAPQQPAIVTMEAPTAVLAGESLVPPETSTARRESRPTPPPTQESARSSSAAAEEHAALALLDAERVLGARALPHRAASYGRVVSQIATGVVIAAISAMIGVAVALLLS